MKNKSVYDPNNQLTIEAPAEKQTSTWTEMK